MAKREGVEHGVYLGGLWIYAQTQQRIHRRVTRAFLRRLAPWSRGAAFLAINGVELRPK